MLFSVILNRKIGKFIPVSVKFEPFIVVLCVCGSASRNFLDPLLNCKMKLQHFAAVTSVLQILFVLRVMFRVYVYWSGSDTYPVFRTRMIVRRHCQWRRYKRHECFDMFQSVICSLGNCLLLCRSAAKCAAVFLLKELFNPSLILLTSCALQARQPSCWRQATTRIGVITAMALASANKYRIALIFIGYN